MLEKCKKKKYVKRELLNKNVYYILALLDQKNKIKKKYLYYKKNTHKL